MEADVLLRARRRRATQIADIVREALGELDAKLEALPDQVLAGGKPDVIVLNIVLAYLHDAGRHLDNLILPEG